MGGSATGPRSQRVDGERRVVIFPTVFRSGGVLRTGPSALRLVPLAHLLRMQTRQRTGSWLVVSALSDVCSI